MLRYTAANAVCKINMDSDLCLAMTAEIRRHFAEKPADFDPRGYLGDGRKAVKDVVMHKVDAVLGCKDKA